MKKCFQKFLLVILVLPMMFSCSTSTKKNRYLGAWVPADNSGYRDDTLRITQVDDNIFVEVGGQALAADYVEAANRLDFQVSAMAMNAKLPLTHIAETDVLWLTGGVNGKRVFERAVKK